MVARVIKIKIRRKVAKEIAFKIKTANQLRQAHFLTHTKRAQQKIGIAKARELHGGFVKMMLKHGMNHNSPFKSLI